MILLFSTAAAAWEPIGAQWRVQPVPYYVDADVPAGLDRDDAIAAMRAGLEAWANEDCGFSLTFQGEHTGGPPGLDGVSVIYMLSADWPEEPTMLTVPIVGVSGNDIEEADLLLNAEFFEWTTDGDGGLPAFDIQGAVAHEAGHFVGLDEVDIAEQTMNPLLNGTEAARTLGEDDVAGLCALYLNPHGLGTEGDTCLESDDCAEDLHCVDNDGDRYCTAELTERGCGCTTGAASTSWISLFVLAAIRRRRQELPAPPSPDSEKSP